MLILGKIKKAYAFFFCTNDVMIVATKTTAKQIQTVMNNFGCANAPVHSATFLIRIANAYPAVYDPITPNTILTNLWKTSLNRIVDTKHTNEIKTQITKCIMQPPFTSFKIP